MTDSRAVAHREPDAPPVRQSENLLAQVIAAAKDPNIDAAKMETLARLVNTQQDREREQEFNRDKNAAIMEMPVITKTGAIVIPAKDGSPGRVQGRYAKLEDIDRVVRPILQRHNLAISFDIAERQGGGLTVTPILSHANGYTERGGGFPLPPENSGSKNSAQAMGSAASYGERYAMCAMLNIRTEAADDDGNMGRNASVSLPFEREQLVAQEAREAFEAGRYLEWFGQQSPKDRGWLVNQPMHVEFGGQPLLASRAAAPGSQRREEASPPPSPARESDQPDPPPPPPPAQEEAGTGPTAGKRTPEQMVESFEKRLDEVENSRAVIDLQAEPKTAQWLANLEARHPALWKRVTDYAARRYSTLVAAERDKARSGESLL